ncbi:MAG TPA: hypothetical protein VGB63_14905 [Pedobacter sp.]|jgi:hypothetical protein
MLSKYVFPLMVVVFAAFYLLNEPLYRLLIREDHLVEWLTFACLLLTGFYSATLAYKIKIKYNYYHWFFISFSAFCVLAGFEEISWGQRVFQVESTEFFKTYSDQKEINMHNTFQGTVGIKTKHIALIAMFIYGVIFSWRQDKDKLFYWLKSKKLIIPPTFLIPGFLMATVLMLDFQTGHEEEIGEFFFSICFLLMILWNHNVFSSDVEELSNKLRLVKQKPFPERESA